MSLHKAGLVRKMAIHRHRPVGRTRSNAKLLTFQDVDAVTQVLEPVDVVALRQSASTMAPPSSTRVAEGARLVVQLMCAMAYKRQERRP